MANITKITARVLTADEENAETEGRVYLGIAGREFLLDNNRQIQRGQYIDYVLGDGANVTSPEYNDPRKPQLDTDDLDRYPVYIRLEEEGDNPAWCLEQAYTTVNPESRTPQQFHNRRLQGTGSDTTRIWLSSQYGTKVYLKRDEA
ncbi:hypothetical protein [Streptomyces aureocirculatus]|uniref:hypothetical protein n=1 Tax=Streptomyces aureocirculatus TaxID=67275 RepID=UPI0004CC7498|nr:hypothetical protein [Streptomyces aureocirculatus]